MRFTDPDWQWLDCIEVIDVESDYEAQTGAVESLAILLSGTFDILAGGGSWMARGVRTSPHDGKPVALFLPPKTRFALHNGRGGLLLVSSRQPEQPSDASQATSEKPLLALAGSGKAFDPASGEWKRQEDFPSSPEAILPRRIELTQQGDTVTRHIAPYDYKALSLTVDECILPTDQHITVTAGSIAGYPTERAVYYDTQGTLTIGDTSFSGQGVAPAITPGMTIQANGGPAHLVFAGAGPK